MCGLARMCPALVTSRRMWHRASVKRERGLKVWAVRLAEEAWGGASGSRRLWIAGLRGQPVAPCSVIEMPHLS